MKTHLLIPFYMLSAYFGFRSESDLYQSDKEKAPVLYFDNFTVIIREGASINCRKIKDMGVVMHFNEEMKRQNVFKIELHRMGIDKDEIVAYKSFNPDTKEFQKKYGSKDSVKLKILTPEDEFNTSDFEPNTLLFPPNAFTNDIVCDHKERHYSFYLVIKGYNKTGKVNRFGEDIPDGGKEISERSIIFKNWENKTK